MRVLLLGMPDVASCFDRVMRIPNLGIASVAANIDGADVNILDLVLHSQNVTKTVVECLEKLQPDVVGLSAMTFQYDTAKAIARTVKSILPTAKTVLGGYHATIAYNLISMDQAADVFDFLIRGEGEQPMNQLVNALLHNEDFSDIPGLSYRVDGRFVHNHVGSSQCLSSVRIPARSTRLSGGFNYFGKLFDVVETSRGCLKTCRFCCIQGMYGHKYRCYPIDRVVQDIADAKSKGAKGIFLVDDNINLQPGRLIELCQAIVDAGLDDLEYISQADVAGFVKEPDLPKIMRRAGFTGVFLGVESTSPENWDFLGKKNPLEATQRVIKSLRDQKIIVAGGFIIGNPGESAADIHSAFQLARKLPLDHAIMWCLTPYPGTEARESMLKEGLVENPNDFSRYNGFICNVRTKHMTNKELVKAIASGGSKLYFSPSFFGRSRAWPRTIGTACTYFRTVSEYLWKARKNMLFASRHRM